MLWLPLVKYMEIKNLVVSVRRGPAWRGVLDQMWYLKRFGLPLKKKNRVPDLAAFTYCVQSSQIPLISVIHSNWRVLCHVWRPNLVYTAKKLSPISSPFYVTCNWKKKSCKLNLGIWCIDVWLSIYGYRVDGTRLESRYGHTFFLFSKTGPNKPPSQWILDFFPGNNEAWKWSWPPHGTI